MWSLQICSFLHSVWHSAFFRPCDSKSCLFWSSDMCPFCVIPVLTCPSPFRLPLCASVAWLSSITPILILKSSFPNTTMDSWKGSENHFSMMNLLQWSWTPFQETQLHLSDKSHWFSVSASVNSLFQLTPLSLMIILLECCPFEWVGVVCCTKNVQTIETVFHGKCIHQQSGWCKILISCFYLELVSSVIWPTNKIVLLDLKKTMCMTPNPVDTVSRTMLFQVESINGQNPKKQ